MKFPACRKQVLFRGTSVRLRAEKGGVADCCASCEGLRSTELRRDTAKGGEELVAPHRRWAARVSILRRNFLATRLNATTSLSIFLPALFCSPASPPLPLPLAKLFPVPRRCNIIFSRLGPQEPARRNNAVIEFRDFNVVKFVIAAHRRLRG